MAKTNDPAMALLLEEAQNADAAKKSSATPNALPPQSQDPALASVLADKEQAAVLGGAPTTEQSWFQSAQNWLAGTQKRQEIPVFSPTEDLGLSSNQMTRLTALILTSPDDERIQAGIKRIVPSAKITKDEFGNLIANVPTKDGVKSFYPNPSGLDLPTLGQLGGGALVGALVKKPIAKVGLPSEGVAGLATIGATEAGLSEAVSSGVSGEGYRFSAPITGAVAGPAFVAAKGLLGAAGKAVGSVVEPLLRMFRKNPQSVVNSAGAFKPEVVDAIRQAGLDPAQVSDEFAAAVANMTRRGVPPEQAVRWQQSQDLPVPVPLTRGEASGNRGQQILETEAEKGAAGELARLQMEAQRQAQSKAIQENIPAMQVQIAAGSPIVERGAGGAQAQARLVARREAQQARYGEAYKTARSSGPSFIDPQSSEQVASRIAGSLSEFRPYTSPTAFKTLDELNTMIREGRSISDLMEFRKVISKLAASADGNERGAGGAMLRALDQELLDQADQKLLYGAPEAVENWLKAIGQFKEFQQLWNTRGGILSKLTAKSERDGALVLNVAPESAANAIFGASTSGLIKKTSLARDLQTLKNNLPVDDWNGIRQEFFMKLADAATNTGVQGGVTGVAFNRVWNALKRENNSLVKIMFKPEEITMLNNFGATVSTVSGAAKNTSNSGFVVTDLISNVLRLLGGGQAGAFVKNVPLIKGLGEAWQAGKVAPSRSPFIIPLSNYDVMGTGALASTVGPEQALNLWDSL